MTIETNKVKAIKMVSECWDSLARVSRRLRNDRDVFEAAFKNCKLAFQFAGPRITSNKEIALIAVQYSPAMFRCVSPRLKVDKDVILAALSSSATTKYNVGQILESIHPKLYRDKDIMLAAIKVDSNAFKYTSEDLRNDKQVVMAALISCSANKSAVLSILNLIDPKYYEDKDIIFTAVNINGDALSYACEELKNDKQIVMRAITESHTAFYSASESLQQDEEVFKLFKEVEQQYKEKREQEMLLYQRQSMLEEYQKLLNRRTALQLEQEQLDLKISNMETALYGQPKL